MKIQLESVAVGMIIGMFFGIVSFSLGFYHP